MTAGEPVDVGFGLGSNIGDKAGHVRRAAALIEFTGLAEALVLSPLYRTAPWGKLDQDWFVNACAAGRTVLPPGELLARIKALETTVGRTATVRWGPRVIDIDILFYGGVVLDTPNLTLPHRDLVNRAFVLVPLGDVRPDLVIGGRTVRERAAAALRGGDVVPLETPPA